MGELTLVPLTDIIYKYPEHHMESGGIRLGPCLVCRVTVEPIQHQSLQSKHEDSCAIYWLQLTNVSGH